MGLERRSTFALLNSKPQLFVYYIFLTYYKLSFHHPRSFCTSSLIILSSLTDDHQLLSSVNSGMVGNMSE